jgi:PilZ domain
VRNQRDRHRRPHPSGLVHRRDVPLGGCQPKIIPTGDCLIHRLRRKKAQMRKSLSETLTPWVTSPTAERRNEKRFQISCPISVFVGRRGRHTEAERGHLCDIATAGARFQFGRALSVGKTIALMIHFPDPPQGVVTVRFTGAVIRTQVGLPFEIAVRLRGGGRFLRDRAEGLCSIDRPAAHNGKE